VAAGYVLAHSPYFALRLQNANDVKFKWCLLPTSALPTHDHSTTHRLPTSMMPLP
jgi:hypothetical protein